MTQEDKNLSKMNKKSLYKTNKKAKMHEIIECPICHMKFEKIQWSQAFCSSQCKDKFHNMRCKDRHLYRKVSEDGMTDHDWDEAFEVAEYNDTY